MKNRDHCISLVSITKAICIVLFVMLSNLVSARDAALLALTIPDDITIECTEDETSANTGEATATSTCGIVTITQSSVETDDCGRTKTITRTWTATDTCGDSVSANQIIIVEDTTPPELELPDDITIECGDDESSLNTGLAFGQDTCSGVRISSTDVTNSGCGNTKTIFRTWLVTDNCSTPTTGVQTITVQDTTPPTLTVPNDITIECNEDASSANTGLATASDTCGDVSSITQSDLITTECGSTKTIVRTWSTTDACGNTASADQTITVQDTTPPTLSIPANITIECGEDESSTNTGLATGTDTCGSVTITQSDVETDDCGNSKTITRTWIATDACGNTTSSDQLIIVEDTSPPSLLLPDDITIECGEDESSTNTGLAKAEDDCGGVSITESDFITPGCGNTKTIIRTWTTFDNCGNTTFGRQIITVEDTTPPVIDNSGLENITIQCGITPDGTLDAWLLNNAGAIATDTCGSVTWSNDFNGNTDIDCANSAISVTFTATDACGNAESTTATYSIVDTINPVLTIPADVTITCTEDTSPSNNGTATATDACTLPTVTFVDSENEACGNTKTITRTWTATDACGNTTSANQIILVEDTTPPAIDNSGLENITIQCGITPDGTLDAWLLNNAGAIATDTCGNVTWSNDFNGNTDVDCANGAIIVTFMATDDCGNAASTTASYSIIDTVNPILTIPSDVTIECTEDTTPANTGVATATDDCTVPNISFSDLETTACGNTKTIIRTWTATDACNNSISAEQTITVQDTTPPTFTTPADLTIECSVDTTDLTITGDVTDESDNCSTDLEATYADTIDAGNCANASIITRTWTLIDVCDNETTLLQTITVVDTTSPIFTVPADLDIECDIDVNDLSITGDVTDENDNCATGLEATYSDSVADGSCVNAYSITRTWSLTDACNNTTTLTQIINVADTTVPTFTVPNDITLNCEDDATDLTLTGDVIDEADNCATNLEATYFDSVTAGNCLNETVITRTWSLSDDCDNTTSFIQTINIIDSTAPTFTVPEDTTIECDSDATDLSNTGDVTDEMDNCSTGLQAIYSDSIVDGDCANAFIITRTWSLTDTCDNTTILIQTINVIDTTAPTFTVPENIIVECDVDITDLSITGDVTDEADNCDPNLEATYTDVRADGDCANAAIIERTWSLIDACDNATTLIQTITIQDTVAPTFTVPDNITLECDVDTTDLSLTGDVVDEADNCSTDLEATYADTIDAGNCANASIITRTWTLIDVCDNETTLLQTITVVDTTSPTFTVPADLDIECDIDVNDLSITGDVTDENDNCATGLEATYSDSVADGSCINAYSITRTWSLTDACNNTTTLTQIINVADTTVPTFTVPNDITLNCEDDATDLTLAGDVIDEADNCATNLEATYFDSVTAGNCLNETVITRTWSLSDDCDNTTSFIQTINIIDTTAPTFTVPEDTTIECDSDATDLSNTGDVTDEMDNCSTGLQAIYSDSIVDGDCANAFIITRTWSLTDTCDNTTILIQTINVMDTTAPTFTVPEHIIVECDVDITDLSITGDVTDEADNCDPNLEATYTDVRADGDCANAAIIERTWSLIDACDNATTLIQTITIQDTVAPTFTVPDNMTLECDVDTTDLSLTGDVIDEADNCSTELEATYIDEILEGSCNNSFTIQRRWALEDDCDNITILIQTITIQDTTAPTFSVPADISVECDIDITDLTLTGDVTDENDNCDTDLEASYTDTIEAGDCANPSIITRLWTLADNCENTTVLIQIITLQDTTAPFFNEDLPENITIECDSDVPTAQVLSATDNCGTSSVLFVENTLTGSCMGNLTIERIWTATDNCGNDRVHTQIITVQDTTAPTLVTAFDEAITVECVGIPQIPDLIFEDSCSNNISVSFNEVSTQLSDFEDYQVIRTWTVTDHCENQGVFTQTITVEINNVINPADANRCVLDVEFDLFDLLSGDFDMTGAWSVVSGDAMLDGSLFDPASVAVGNYTFNYAITEGACPNEVEVNVAIDDDCVVLPCGSEDVIISKTVTANGDNFNEFFAITGVEDCGFVVELQIFNRWGAEIYKSNNYQNNWNGDAHGASAGRSGKVPTGTYYYIINLRNSGLEPFAGPIYVATTK